MWWFSGGDSVGLSSPQVSGGQVLILGPSVSWVSSLDQLQLGPLCQLMVRAPRFPVTSGCHRLPHPQGGGWRWGGQRSWQEATRVVPGPECHRCSCAEGSRAGSSPGNAVGALGCVGIGVREEPPQERAAPSTGIRVSSSSSSAASPSEGTSSDSCLTSAGNGPVGLSACLAAQGLVGTCSPLRLASPLLGAQSATPVLQAQGALGGAAMLPVSFQEGRRASDTSLTQGEPLRSRFHLPREMLCVALEGRFVLDGRGSPLL